MPADRCAVHLDGRPRRRAGRPGDRTAGRSIGGRIDRDPARRGSVVPHVEQRAGGRTAATWSTSRSPGPVARDHPTLPASTRSCWPCFFGTMGLPHVLVRFYTNPDGRAARRTTLVVIGLLGAFYVFTAVLRGDGPRSTPPTCCSPVARTPSCSCCRAGCSPSPLGDRASAMLLVAGAFAAFLSTSSGLTVSVAGVLSQDLLRGRLRSTVRGLPAGRRPRRRSSRGCSLLRDAGARASPTPSGSRSRWPPRRSARCSSWGSGGDGLTKSPGAVAGLRRRAASTRVRRGALITIDLRVVAAASPTPC